MNKRFGFTLMETVIVLGLISLILPIIFAIVFSITRQQAKVYVLSTIKREGDNALSIMENTIRNKAIAIYTNEDLSTPVCTSKDNNHESSDGTDFYLSDNSGEWFKFSQSSNQIASSSSIVNAEVDLTSSSNTRITSFNINCQYISDFSKPVVGISFTIEQKQTQYLKREEIASLNYSTKIKLR
ncbi:MAG: hypothetical protein ABH812_00790 [bacterium]